MRFTLPEDRNPFQKGVMRPHATDSPVIKDPEYLAHVRPGATLVHRSREAAMIFLCS